MALSSPRVTSPGEVKQASCLCELEMKHEGESSFHACCKKTCFAPFPPSWMFEFGVYVLIPAQQGGGCSLVPSDHGPILSRKQDAPLLISPYFRYAMSCGSRALEPSVRLQPLMGALEIGFTHRHFHRSMSHLGHPSTGLRIETSSALTDPTSEALAMPEPLPSDPVGGPTLFPICQNQRSPKTA